MLRADNVWPGLCHRERVAAIVSQENFFRFTVVSTGILEGLPIGLYE